ncbi:MerR family transcriptional regulator [Litchfieldia alkalitelluris]|uniref:MerR family transcriptional regulator n=1 Tax=Litchfieldia alkalitelluris TaxID=304268 RepID=UPI000997C0F5|nr:MerR family transcriptional regulator [Litchfieldia alkalitelluris]
MNTAALAAKVGVSIRTIRKWIKFFDLHCNKNEHGHYVFTDEDYTFFCQIRDHVASGRPKHEIKINTPRKGILRNTMIKTTEHPLQQQISSLLERIERNEKNIERKASEVVSYQLLQHRREIDELNQKVEKLEAYIQDLEKEKKTLLDTKRSAEPTNDSPITLPRAKKTKALSLFF